MLSGFKKKMKKASLIAPLIAGLLLLPASPASATGVQADIVDADSGSFVALGNCAAAGATTGSSMTVAITGTANAPGAVAVRIRCGVVQNGSVVASSTTALPGSFAATARTTAIGVAPYTVCAEIYALFIDGSEASRSNCP